MDDTTEEMANNTVLPEIQYRADFIGKSSFFIRSQFLHPIQLTLHVQQKATHEEIFVCATIVIVKDKMTSLRLPFVANEPTEKFQK